MKTDICSADSIETGDILFMFGEILTVKEKNDREQVILTLCDEDGMCETFAFEPYDEMVLYFGEDDVEFEEVDPD